MILSMTGFGKAICELDDKAVTIEIKSLNSKQLDIYSRLPNLYKDKELEIRNILSQNLVRGKIDFAINYENTDSTTSGKINATLVKEYYRQMTEIGNDLKLKFDESIISTIMRFPDTLKVNKEELDEEDWIKVLSKIEEALNSVIKYRQQEGDALQIDILSRVNLIEKFLEEIVPFEEARMQRMREKIYSGLNESFEQDKIDKNRFEQELIYYLEKLDITEEKVRLKNHCDFFIEVTGDKLSNGKKLSFIVQEMGREINTIGSKANHSEIQKIVVQMKDELEKIKEQLMNVL